MSRNVETGQNGPSREALALELGSARWGAAWRPAIRADAPGRIELLGNHLDYNGGRVLAGAIDRRITLLGGPGAEDGAIEVAYRDPHSGEAVISDVLIDDLAGWRRDSPPESPADYLRGAVAALMAEGRDLRGGFRVAVAGDVPVGLGLSSSAALSVGLIGVLTPDRPDFQDLVLLAQAAENRAGVACGTMDQATSVSGGVIRYDAATISAARLEPTLGEYVFVVVSSGVVHRLGESAYPVRVREMAHLFAIAREVLGEDVPDNVAALTRDQILRLDTAGALTPSLAGRARHVVSEGERVAQGYDALLGRDWGRFGELMTASGRSSAVDYDVSHPQVEELVAEILTNPGVLGARMMGGGGGGSVLALVRSEATSTLSRALDGGYFTHHGLTSLPDRFLTCAFATGATVDSLEGQGDRYSAS